MLTKKDVLNNGVRLLTANVAGVESCTVQVFVKAGSRDEKGNTYGLAHFLEHMVFKGTSRYPSANQISTAADSVGAEINASTSKEWTSFYLKVTEKHIKLAFDLLSDMVLRPNLDPKEIEREKGVIVSEIQMYEDLPPNRAYSAFEEIMFSGTDLSHDVAGKKETVTKLTKSEFSEFRERLYKSERMVVAVAGKFDQAQVRELAEEYFGTSPTILGVLPGALPRRKPTRGPFSGVPLRPSPLGSDRVKLITKKTEQAHVFLGFPASQLGSKDRYIEAVLAAILGGGMSSRLFTEVRERRGLAYYISTVLEHYTDGGYVGARMGTGVEKSLEAIKIVCAEFEKISNFHSPSVFFPISNEEMGKSKEYTKGKFILSLEDTENVSDFIGEDELLEGKHRGIEEVVKGVDAVTQEDIGRVAKTLFDPKKLKLAVVGPYKDEAKFENLLGK